MNKNVFFIFFLIFPALSYGQACIEAEQEPVVNILRLCTLPYLLTAQEGIDTALARESICCSTIDITFGMFGGMVAQNMSTVQHIESAMNLCSSSLEQQLTSIESKLDAISVDASVDLSPVTSLINSCCSALDSQLSTLESKIDNLPQINLAPIASKLDVCGSLAESELQQAVITQQSIIDTLGRIESEIEALPTLDLMPLSSKLDICCSGIESQLQILSLTQQSVGNSVSMIESMVQELPTVDLTPINSRLDVCCSTIETQLNTLSGQQAPALSSSQAVSSQLDSCASLVEAQIGSMNGQLANNLIAVQDVSSNVDSYNSVIESLIGSLSSEVGQNLSITQSISSKLDTYNSFIDTQLSVIESMLSSCTASTISAASNIATSGVYTLCADSAGTYTISGSDITFDLNSHTISGGLYGIAVSGKNVTVRNGTIKNALNADILLTGTQCFIRSCDLIGSQTGIQITNGGGHVIDGCRAINNSRAGYSLNTSYTCMLTNCTALNLTGSSDVYGFYANGGAQNSFNNCQANSIASRAGKAIGYGLYAETGDKVLNSQAYNCIASTTAFANGLVLGMNYTLLSTITQATYGTAVSAVAWSADSRYVAVGGSITSAAPTINIYSFTGSLLTTVTSTSFGASGSSIYSLAWSPDGRYLLVGAQSGMALYAFNGILLTFITGIGTFAMSQWSPDGRYIATAIVNGGNFVNVYTFDGITITLLASITPAAQPNAVSWSPDGNYIAFTTSGSQIQVLFFDGYRVQSIATVGVSGSTNANAISWAPNGRYLALAQRSSSGNNLVVYSFNGSSLTTVTGALLGGSNYAAGLSWSSDGRYLAVAQRLLNNYFVYSFDGSQLLAVSGLAAATLQNAVSWSPNGNYLAYGLTNGTISVLSTGTGCAQCDIENNAFEGIANAAGMGTSYAASTGANLLVNNRAFANDLNYSGPSMTASYGDRQYIQTLAAAIWKIYM